MVVVKDSTSYLLFPTIKKVHIKINEIIGLVLYEGESIFGVVDEICSDNEHFWLRSSVDFNSHRQKFSFKIDQIIKLN